jgi:hypothetical protein
MLKLKTFLLITKFLKIVRSQKKLYLNELSRIWTGHPVYIRKRHKMSNLLVS